MEYPYTFNVLEECRISPPSGSVPRTSIRLTYFDLPELSLDPPIHCLYFYKHQCSKADFLQSVLPKMKHSFSIALQYFISLAGNLTWYPESTLPEFVYVDGDSVLFTAVESDFSFDKLSGSDPRDAKLSRPLTSELLPRSSANAGLQYPVMAVRVTLFPNAGICVGLTITNSAADGIAFNHFMKFWASLCRLGGDIAGFLSDDSDHLLPLYDQSKITDPYAAGTAHLRSLKDMNICQQSFTLPLPPTDIIDKLVASFVIESPTIERLKKWVLRGITERNKKEPTFDLTSEVVTLACVWICWCKALDGDAATDNVVDDPREYILIPVECRARLDPALPITYFGNCQTFCIESISRNDLYGEDGIVIASELIGKALQSFHKSILDDYGNLLSKFASLASERVFGVSESLRMKSYDVDFGWGMPKRVELITCTTTIYEWIVVFEYSDQEKEGLEVGVALKKHELDAFTSLFQNLLRIKSSM